MWEMKDNCFHLEILTFCALVEVLWGNTAEKIKRIEIDAIFCPLVRQNFILQALLGTAQYIVYMCIYVFYVCLGCFLWASQNYIAVLHLHL